MNELRIVLPILSYLPVGVAARRNAPPLPTPHPRPTLPILRFGTALQPGFLPPFLIYPHTSTGYAITLSLVSSFDADSHGLRPAVYSMTAMPLLLVVDASSRVHGRFLQSHTVERPLRSIFRGIPTSSSAHPAAYSHSLLAVFPSDGCHDLHYVLPQRTQSSFLYTVALLPYHLITQILQHQCNPLVKLHYWCE